MEELTKIAKLLGEENEKKLRDSMTDILIERFEEDLNDMNCYLVDYEALFDEIRKEVKSIMKDKVIKMYMAKAEEKFSELFE